MAKAGWVLACAGATLALALPVRATPVDTASFTETAWVAIGGGNVTAMAWAPDGSR